MKTGARSGCASRNKRGGSGELGSCPTDATREGRFHCAVRKFAAMRTPERLRLQSSRHIGPAVPYKSSVPFKQTKHFRTGQDRCQGLTADSLDAAHP
jgi:hypothetical protein